MKSLPFSSNGAVQKDTAMVADLKPRRDLTNFNLNSLIQSMENICVEDNVERFVLLFMFNCIFDFNH